MNIQVYKPHEQASGQFDDGRIVEQKPIGFPGEGSAVSRVGPLFYWAWAKASDKGEIGLHPHKGFEIITYMLTGSAAHVDTLGTESIVSEGGAQVMQTGSGLFHGETFFEGAEGFQIWLEPNLQEAMKRPPAYRQYGHDEFPIRDGDGVQVKTVLGDGSPIDLVCPARMWDIRIAGGQAYRHFIPQGRSLAVLSVEGGARLEAEDGAVAAMEEKDFAVAQALRSKPGHLHIQAASRVSARFAVIEVDSEVDYPLYPKRF